LYADEGSATELEKSAPELKVQVVRSGDELEVAGVKVRVEGTEHAEIHKTLPRIPNVGYLLGGKLFVPGDNYTKPAEPVEVLAFASGAPWMKIGEAVDYVLAVHPKVAIPYHDAVLAMPEMNSNIISGLVRDSGVEIRVVPNGQSTEF
jgi:L-ascorbate metabolism protein UlaG (beta-lactamase superfamily)